MYARLRRRPPAAWLLLAFVVLGAASASANLVDPAPRPISPGERAAVAMALAYLDEGADVLWDHLAASAPLRALGRDAAQAELAVRFGPRDDTEWILTTPSVRYTSEVAIFSLTFASGLEETLMFEMVEEDTGWRLETLRSLVDPSEMAAASVISTATVPVAPGIAPTPSHFTAMGAVALVGLVIALRGRRRPPIMLRPGPRPASLATALLTGMALVLASCGGPTNPEARVDDTQPAGPNLLRLHELAALRHALAADGIASEGLAMAARTTTGMVRDAAALWLAQSHFHRGDLPAAREALAPLPSDSSMPLASLLRARLAFVDADGGTTSMHYDHAKRLGPDHDMLQIEMIDSETVLGFGDEAEIILTLLARGGSRFADIYYLLAGFMAAYEQDEQSETLVRAAWALHPAPRRVMFSNPLLANVAARPSLMKLFALDQSDEPVVPRRVIEDGVPPLALPADAEANLVGDHFTVAIGRSRIEVPGGGVLAPPDTPSLDAGTALEQEQQMVLERVDEIIESVQESGIPGLLRRETETLARALAEEERWSELEALTRGFEFQVDRVRPALVKLRALALDKLELAAASRDLLVELARSDIAHKRRDPATLYQLADNLAAAGRYDLAIKLVQRAHRISPLRVSSSRIRLYEMEQRLAEQEERLATKHFDLVFPRSAGDRYPRQVGLVLEAEHERLSHWIKVPQGHRIEVQLFPLEEFLRAYASSVAVVGIYDGRVRVPLADLKSLHPALVAILTHEVAHAMIAGATDDHAPRWLQEGLAQHVEMANTSINPYPDLHAAGRTLSLPVIETILMGFAEAQFIDLAYSEAAWLVHGIEARYGVKGIHRLLAAYRQGPDDQQAIAQAFGKDAVAFERDLIAWAVNEAPPSWPTQVRRYDRELEDGLWRRTAQTNLAAVRSLGAAPREVTNKERAARQRQKAREVLFAWHQRYTRASVPVKRALGPIVATFRPQRTSTFDPRICTTLQGAVNAVTADTQTMSPPDPDLKAALTRAYVSLQQVSIACQQSNDKELLTHLAAAEKALTETANLLRPHGLRP